MSASSEYGLDAEDLIFDALTFTLATGQEEFVRSAIETLDGIRAIKRELPGVWTVLGVSNLSFGLAPHSRPALNSVFLHHAIEAGLDAAIVNPAHVQPYGEISDEERELAEDLIFDRRDGRAAALHRALRGAHRAGRRSEAIRSRASPPTADPRQDPAPQARRRRGRHRPGPGRARRPRAMTTPLTCSTTCSCRP